MNVQRSSLQAEMKLMSILIFLSFTLYFTEDMFLWFISLYRGDKRCVMCDSYFKPKPKITQSSDVGYVMHFFFVSACLRQHWMQWIIINILSVGNSDLAVSSFISFQKVRDHFHQVKSTLEIFIKNKITHKAHMCVYVYITIYIHAFTMDYKVHFFIIII